MNSKYFSGTSSAVVNLAFSNSQGFRKALDACGEDKEFKDIKKDLEKVVEIVAGTFSGAVTAYGDIRDLETIEKILDTIDKISPYLYSIRDQIDEWSRY